MQPLRLIKVFVVLFATIELAPCVVSVSSWPGQALANVVTTSSEVTRKKHRKGKGKKKLQKRQRKKKISQRKGNKPTTKTLAAKSRAGQQRDDGLGVFSLLFLVLLMGAAAYGIFIAYKRSHPEMEWDGIRGQEDTGLRPPGKTNVAGPNYSKAKWRLLGKRGAENPHPAFGEEPGPASVQDPNDS